MRFLFGLAHVILMSITGVMAGLSLSQKHYFTGAIYVIVTVFLYNLLEKLTFRDK